MVEDTQDCVNLDFVVGSAAEIERVWSMANYILVKERTSMSPIMFEALIFLKFNVSYWDDALILKAYSKALNKQRSERLEKRLEELQVEEELESWASLNSLFSKNSVFVFDQCDCNRLQS